MTDLRHFNRQTLLASLAATCFAIVYLGFVGCGGSQPVSQQATPSEDRSSRNLVETANIKAVANERPGIAASELLVGTWLGAAYLDGRKLDGILEKVSPQSKAELELSARNFLTTVMAIDFRNDGSVVNDIEISPIGRQPIREGSTGTWRVVEIDDRRIVVETTESLADGSNETSQKVCRLYEDGDHFAIQIELPGQLAECNPMLVFARQEMGPTSLAEAPADATKK